MPKRLKERRPKSDPNQAAHDLIRRIADEEDNATLPPIPKGLSAYMAALGRKGGRVGGKRRLETMTAAERSQVASDAARAMWAKRKAAKKR